MKYDLFSIVAQIMKKTCSFLEDLITSSNEVFKDIQCDITVEIWKMGNSTWETLKSTVIVQ